MLGSITLALILASVAPSEPSAAPVQSGDPAASSTAAHRSTPSLSDRDRIVCWTEAPLGSRVPKKLCATQAQLDELRTRAHDYKSSRDLDAGVPVRMGAGGGPH